MATFRFPTGSYPLFTLKTGQFEAKKTIQKATFDFCFCEANLDQRCQFFLKTKSQRFFIDRDFVYLILYFSKELLVLLELIVHIWTCVFVFISGMGGRGTLLMHSLIEIFQLGPVERAVLTQVLGDSRPHKRKIQLRCETCSVSFNSQVRKIIPVIMVRVVHVILNFYNGQGNLLATQYKS